MDAQLQKLKELDVREGFEGQNPNKFLALYLVSNFPQTIAHPSKQQKEQLERGQTPAQPVNYMKKPSSGISFDNPAAR